MSLRVVVFGALLLVLVGCIYRPVADLSPPLTAPANVADDGHYQWVVVAEVKEVNETPSPGFCLSFICNEEFLQASLNVSRILGNAKNPVPTKVLFGNEFGDDPFYHDPGSHYLMFIHSGHGVPTLGVYLPLLWTSNGQLAVPGEYLIPFWEKAGCSPYLKSLDFTGNPDLRMRQIGTDAPEYWTGEGYGAKELQFGEIQHGRLIYTKGVLLKDMETQAAKLYIGCGAPSSS